MVNFEVRLAGFEQPLMSGKTNHIPRVGESLFTQNLVFRVQDIIWEFNAKFAFGCIATILVAPPRDTRVEAVSKTMS